ncbi:MAG: Fe-S cluster assembly protein SufB [bacterium]|nr:Fe-S cluster assembly protein SufB [bacterium]
MVDEPLQAYFRMNSLSGGQFEHTLIIVDDDAAGDYIEGCSAPKFNQLSLHAGGVEVYVGKRSRMRYSSVENRSINTYNLNTKRAIVEDDGFMERVNGNLGSGVTMLYPCSILKGDRSRSDQLGIAVAGKGQQQDTGSKVIHIGKDTSSTIVSKSISKDGGVATYRGIVDIKASADNAVNSTECDALLMDELSVSTTIPHISVQNDSATVAHEASAGKVDATQLFYIQSRGVDEEKAMAMIVNGFISPIVRKLPLEYAGELNRLIEMEMEGSV